MIALGIEPATLLLGAQCLNLIDFFFPVALGRDCGLRPPLTGLCDHIHWTHHTRYDFSGVVISPTKRPVPDNTQHSQ